MKTIYVGNIPFRSSESELRELFEQHGQVYSVKLISDRATGRPHGFGFLEMDDETGTHAISALNNANFQGRTLKVNESHMRKPQPRLQNKSAN